MSLAKHLEDAAVRLKEASFRVDEARRKAVTPESVREWLEALTDFVQALSDIQTYNNESIHEKLHDLGSRIGLRSTPGGRHAG
jgi:hypothetical protein